MTGSKGDVGSPLIYYINKEIAAAIDNCASSEVKQRLEELQFSMASLAESYLSLNPTVDPVRLMKSFCKIIGKIVKSTAGAEDFQKWVERAIRNIEPTQKELILGLYAFKESPECIKAMKSVNNMLLANMQNTNLSRVSPEEESRFEKKPEQSAEILFTFNNKKRPRQKAPLKEASSENKRLRKKLYLECN